MFFFTVFILIFPLFRSSFSSSLSMSKSDDIGNCFGHIYFKYGTYCAVLRMFNKGFGCSGR